MKPLLEAELLKLRTTRTFAALVGAALALSLLFLVLGALLVDYEDEESVKLLFSGDFTPIFILLLGAMGMAGEWRHRTVTSSVLAAPDRLRLMVAKTLSYAVAGVVVSFVVTVSLMLVGTIILSARDQLTLAVGDLVDILWRNLVIAAYLGAVGVCIGAIVRNQVAAIIGLVIYALVAESALFFFVPDIAKYLPINGAPSGVAAATPDQVDDDLLFSPLASAFVMLTWVGVLFAAGAALLRRRDLT